ncbi:MULTISPECIES: hypothetical protein [unclassified Exiguobacterium]|uniref:hypothetical protein n=1 Tax=unclassified Exiguobacterium TaxID=2644629 RepID=UPI001BEA6F09|nr:MULTISPECIES: hypothetical protein [unclassified Exiguobacterium]
MNHKTLRDLFDIPPPFVRHPFPSRLLRFTGRLKRPKQSSIEVVFRVGGFGVFDVSTLTFFENGTVLRHVDQSALSISEEFEGEEAEQIRMKFESLGTHRWPAVFEEAEGIITVDGTQWNLSVYANGKLIHEHVGSNAYPDQWRQLTQLFCIS